MKMYQIKTFIILLLFSLSSYGQNQRVDFRKLKSLYQIINEDTDKVEVEPLVLKNYHLLVSAATWNPISQNLKSNFEALAVSKSKDLNIILVYDNYKQDLNSIKSQASQTTAYEFFDKGRRFYYWFEIKTIPAAVLLGPDDKILYSGELRLPEHFQAVESKIRSTK